jgi:hypothetical protein
MVTPATSLAHYLAALALRELRGESLRSGQANDLTALVR